MFEGVDSCMSLWLNNQYIGYSQDSCLSAEFDITKQLGKLNTHTLSVQVSRWCDGSYIEDQDKWWLSGIYREVYLVRKPRIYISDYEFTVDMKNTSSVTDIGKNNDVNVNIQVVCEGLNGDDCAVKVELYDARDKSRPPILSQVAPIKASASAADPVYISAHQEVSCSAVSPYTSDVNQIVPSAATSAGACIISAIVTNPSLWTAETPHLYILVLSLHSGLEDAEKGSYPIDVEGCRVGIRDVRLHSVSNALCVNDRPITIAGVNRHEFHPKTGRSVDESTMRLDAAILKQLNFNAVRLSHYPNHRRWLEICDEAGLYVIDEANIESHGFQVFGQAVGYLSHQPEWKGAMLSRIARMCERDKNYPCIIGWSLGNESGVGPNHEAGSAFLRSRDPRRFVQYESGGACTKVTDIICPMYLRPAWCRNKAQNDPLKRPVILCEYAHAMGNSGGCLAQYWKDFRDPALPRLQGGFIWDYIDQGLLLPEPDDALSNTKKLGAPRYGYGGDFGDIPNTKQFCINGLLGPDRIPHPSAFEAASLQSPMQASLGVESSSTSSADVTIDQLYLTITNYRSHTSSSDVVILLKLTCDMNTHNNTRAYNQQHTIVFPSGDSISPGSRKSILVGQLWPSLVSKSTPVQQLRALFPGIREEDAMAIQEVWIDVIVQVKPERGSEWVPGGHIVLRTSLFHKALNECIRNKIALLNYASYCGDMGVAPACTENNTHLRVQWDNGNYANVCKDSGLIDSWRTSDEEDIITNPISVCLYRAPLDNDMGGDFIAYKKQWETWGIHCLQHKERTAVKVTVVPPTQDADSIAIEVKYVLYPAQKVLSPVDIPVTLLYTFHGGDQSVTIHSKVSIPSVLPAIPRVGLRFAINPTYDEIKWYGLGPHEAYDDRQSCVYLDTFISSVENLHTPYVYPTESGRRADPRWVAATTPSTGSNGVMNGIMIIPSDSEASVNRADSISGYGWSASYYSLEMLSNSAHEYELRADAENNIYIHVDSHMMGIGGYDSWSPNVDSDRLIKGDDRVPKETSVNLVPLCNATSESITRTYTTFIKQKYG